jgi:hypothetical protein
MVKFVRTNQGIAPFALCLLEVENDESSNRINSAIHDSGASIWTIAATMLDDQQPSILLLLFHNPDANFIEVSQQLCRILIHPIGPYLF